MAFAGVRPYARTMTQTAGDLSIEPELLAAAIEVQARAYAPYSHFLVGAAIRTRIGRVFSGCNVENAAYPQGTCAEAGAIAAMVAAGEREIDVRRHRVRRRDAVHPVRWCRQKIREFADADTVIHAAGPGGVASPTRWPSCCPTASAPRTSLSASDRAGQPAGFAPRTVPQRGDDRAGPRRRPASWPRAPARRRWPCVPRRRRSTVPPVTAHVAVDHRHGLTRLERHVVAPVGHQVACRTGPRRAASDGDVVRDRERCRAVVSRRPVKRGAPVRAALVGCRGHQLVARSPTTSVNHRLSGSSTTRKPAVSSPYSSPIGRASGVDQHVQRVRRLVVEVDRDGVGRVDRAGDGVEPLDRPSPARGPGR